MKGQVALETIIMLVVLLVLASVIIALVLSTLKPPPRPEKAISKSEFLSTCESYCNDPDKIAEYCRLYWNGNDWNLDRFPNDLIKVGGYNWYACEDRIYCFLVEPCDRLGTGLSLIKRCKDVLCGIYLDKYGDANLATQRLLEDIGFSVKCSFSSIPPEENWYEKIFREGCG